MSTPKTTKKTPIDLLAIFVATGGGAGFLPKAPGTAGAAVGVLVYLAMHAAGASAYFLHAILLILFAGTLAAHRVENFWGHDSQRIVVDEVVGQMIAFSLAGKTQLSGVSIFAGFVLFRVFDITKPFPIRRFEKLPGGVGVMADDVGAGIYALALLTLAQYLFGI
jgi:phosphatidylglycerophosphatase A